jgi:ribosomal protein L11 methyltransferase
MRAPQDEVEFGPRLWTLAVEVPKQAVDAFGSYLATLSDTYSCFEAGAGWRLEALLDSEPDRSSLAAGIARAAAAAGIAVPDFALAPLPPRDWLAENRRQFPPLAVGRFFIHGSHFAGTAPAGRIAIRLDAGLAFGSGSHESTRGCLIAIERLARRRRFRRPLDLGCGSGILAIAMARLWRRQVAAADIDPVAVAVARENGRRNGVGPLLRPVASDGLASGALRRGRYDLVVANILARPLERLAPSLARVRCRHARVVLSGLLAGQAAGVLAAYRAQGLALERRIRIGNWVTLLLATGGPPATWPELTPGAGAGSGVSGGKRGRPQASRRQARPSRNRPGAGRRLA